MSKLHSQAALGFTYVLEVVDALGRVSQRAKMVVSSPIFTGLEI